MPSSFSLILGRSGVKDPRAAALTVAAVLLVANVAAGLVTVHPWGGSAEGLRRRQDDLHGQATAAEERLARSRALAGKVEHAREEGDRFLAQYVTDRRVSTSAILDELNRVARESGVSQKEVTFLEELVEGSDALLQVTISAGYEGSYHDLAKFVNLVDKSPRFLIIENMQATPQQSGPNLNVSFKLDTFVRETPGGES